MHPILATRWRTLLYLAGWVPVLALLNYVMWAAGGVNWVQNTAVLGPACFLFAFACLSPWPMARMERRSAAHLDLLFGVGILLYLLSAGLHYTALAAEEAREAALAV